MSRVAILINLIPGKPVMNSLAVSYLISLFTLWLGLISLYFLFIKEASYKWLFFSISLLIVISQSQELIDISLELYDKALKLL